LHGLVEDKQVESVDDDDTTILEASPATPTQLDDLDERDDLDGDDDSEAY